MSTTDTRQHVHDLVDQLPPAQLAAVEGLLSVMVDPVTHGLQDAPAEDEEMSEEEEQAATRSKEWFKHNQGTSFEDLVTELGFSMEDIIRKARTPPLEAD
ncbi:MAG: hypothetical protein JO061_22115 [Acidobacteriaceae bacterium]|nr:hypothetical protein [Acidobacteriaceae bacterium]